MPGSRQPAGSRTAAVPEADFDQAEPTEPRIPRRAAIGGLVALGGGLGATYLALRAATGGTGSVGAAGQVPGTSSTTIGSVTADGAAPSGGAVTGAMDAAPLVEADRQRSLVVVARTAPSIESSPITVETTATTTPAEVVPAPARIPGSTTAPTPSTTAPPTSGPDTVPAETAGSAGTGAGKGALRVDVTPSQSTAAPQSSSTTVPGSTSDPVSPSSTTSVSQPTTVDEPATLEPLTPVASGNGVTAEFVARRIAFGVSPALLADIERRGVGGWIEDQLSRTGPDPAVEARFPNNSIVKQNREQIRASKFEPSVTQSVIYRARYSSHQLYEMMTLLWADHLNINLAGSNRLFFVPLYQEKVIRPHAMGRYADLLRATAESEGMMWYLDNHLSDASEPNGINENYGRELLELHTVGVENHSEADVVAAAKIMSGWTVKNYPGDFTFDPKMHASETVTVLGRTFPAAGKAQGEALLDYLARHPDTARTIATKICRRFVSDQPPSDLVDSAARVYLDNDTNVVPVLRHVFASRQFAESGGLKLRRPLEFVVACLRATDADVGAGSNRVLHRMLGDLGNVPWDWAPPDGYPDTAPYWADTTGFSLRWGFAARLCSNGIEQARIDGAALTAGADTAGAYITGLARRFGIGPLPERDVDAVLSAYGLDRGSALSGVRDVVRNDLAALVLCHPSFQLR